MEKIKILLLVVVVVIVASHLGLNWFKWGELDAARNDIKDAQKHIAEAVKSLDSAQQNISLLIGNIDSTKIKLSKIDQSVVLLNSNMKQRIGTISTSINKLRDSITLEERKIKQLQESLQKLE